MEWIVPTGTICFDIPTMKFGHIEILKFLYFHIGNTYQTGVAESY